jgi:preprotein translocase subunit YajC
MTKMSLFNLKGDFRLMDQSLTNMILWFAVFFGIIYFIIIRPNNKQQKERRNMLDSLKVKDKVITIGGLHGTVTKINEDTVIIKVAPNVELEFLRTAIQSIENRDYKEGTTGKGRKLRRKKDAAVQETGEQTDNPYQTTENETVNEEENK